MPTVGAVVSVVDAQLRAGRLRCLAGSCWGVLAPWGWGVEREVVGLGGRVSRLRPRRARCRGCQRSRVLLPDTVLRRRQYSVEVVGAGLLAAAGRRPWTKVAVELGVPYQTVRAWLRRFAGRAELVRAWLSGLLLRLVDDPRVPAGQVWPAADALAVLAALREQLPGRWPVVATLTGWQLVARLSRGALLAPHWPPQTINTSAPVTSVQVGAMVGGW